MFLRSNVLGTHPRLPELLKYLHGELKLLRVTEFHTLVTGIIGSHTKTNFKALCINSVESGYGVRLMYLSSIINDLWGKEE